MQRKNLGVVLILLVAFVLSACGGSDADLTPTVSVELIRTQAVLTYQAQSTQTALANPTATATATKPPTLAPTFSGLTAGTPAALGTAPTTAGVGASACYGLAFVSDVTIPDGTQMTPGQSFTKTWRVTNSGTCAWEAGFKWNIVAGEAMGGVAVSLNQRVEPGRQYEFSVPMVAPNSTGKVRGTWRLSDANGTFFGDSPWVEITVGGGAAATSTTGAATSTTAPPTAAETATP